MRLHNLKARPTVIQALKAGKKLDAQDVCELVGVSMAAAHTLISRLRADFQDDIYVSRWRRSLRGLPRPVIAWGRDKDDAKPLEPYTNAQRRRRYAELQVRIKRRKASKKEMTNGFAPATWQNALAILGAAP